MEVGGRGGDGHHGPPVAPAAECLAELIGAARGGVHQAETLVDARARRFQRRVVLGHEGIVLEDAQPMVELGAVPQHLLAVEGLRAIPVLLGGGQRAGGRARPAAGRLRGAAGLRRHDRQVAAVDAVVGAAVDGDARRLDDLCNVDVLHPAPAYPKLRRSIPGADYLASRSTPRERSSRCGMSSGTRVVIEQRASRVPRSWRTSVIFKLALFVYRRAMTPVHACLLTSATFSSHLVSPPLSQRDKIRKSLPPSVRRDR